MSLLPDHESWILKKANNNKPQKNLRALFLFNLKALSPALQKEKKKDEVMELYLHTSLREFPYRNLDNVKIDININLVFLNC